MTRMKMMMASAWLRRSFGGALAVALAGAAALSAAPAAAALPVESWTAPTGARVLFMASPSIPMLDVKIDFDAGSRFDPPGRRGLASLTADLLDKGVTDAAPTASKNERPARMDEAQIADAFADVGAMFSAGASMDRASVRLRTLTAPDARERAIDMAARILRAPAFPAAVLAREKQRAIAAHREALTRPETLGSRALHGAMYADHPYGREISEASIKALTRDEVIRFHAARYSAKGAVVTIIGALSRPEAEIVAVRLTSQLPAGTPAPQVPDVKPRATGEVIRIAHPAQQAHLMLGQPALARNDPDYFPLTVGNYVLGGGGFVSRLMTEVREKRGLVYSVYSQFGPMKQPGPFMIGLQTRRDQAESALAVVREVLDGFQREGPTEAELQAAKDNLVNGFALRIDSNRELLDHLATIGWYGLPLDYLDTWTQKVAAVRVEDVRRAFARHVDPATLVTVVIAADPVK